MGTKSGQLHHENLWEFQQGYLIADFNLGDNHKKQTSQSH